MRHVILAAAAVFIAITSAIAAEAPPFTPPNLEAAAAPAGKYTIEPSHTHIVFKISHLGLSQYFGRFNNMEGELDFNPADPTKSSVNVTVHTGSVDTTSDELDAKLDDESFFNLAKFPTATFKSTKIEKTGNTTGTIHGDLTLLGVTKPIKLEAVFNGFGENPFSKTPILGFSATTSIKRSDFGMSAYAPALGDEVQLMIETEFQKMEAAKPAPAAEKPPAADKQ